MSPDPTLFQRTAWRIVERMPAAGHARSLLVTSSRRGEGKTFVATGLAQALNLQFPGSIALVDCTASAPAWTAPEASVPAWSEMVAAASVGPRAPKRADGQVIHIGFGNGDAASAYRAAGIARALDGLRKDFDFIILDGPVLADCGALSRCADASLLVIDGALTNRETVKGGLQSDPVAARKIMGAVINRRPQYVPGWLYRRAF